MELDRDAARYHGDQNEALRFVRSGHPLVDSGQFSDCWYSSTYTVLAREQPIYADEAGPPIVYLSVKRNDKGELRDWRHLQAIKNCVVGFEGEGVELYPRESRLVDEANQYHIYCLRPPHGFPLGDDLGRMVGTPEDLERLNEGTGRVGGQREFEPGTRVPKSVRSKARRRQ